MTDRELLEYAAKAAGIPLRDLDDQWDNWEPEPVRIHRGWNPIEYDGDAFRLAVKLDLNVMIGVVRTPCGFTAIAYSETGEKDDNECTRRAIVRAAAEIGKAMV